MSENQPKSSTDESVFKKISRLNGKINDMTKEKLMEQLQVLHLNPKGVKSVLKRRLKSYHKRRLLTNVNVKQHTEEHLYDYFVVIDFEATCEKDNSPKYRHEIIEFPAVLVDFSEQKIVDEFHSYVRPVLNKKLSTFCIELTGITQSMVDDAPIFETVLNNFEEWLNKHHLGSRDHRFAVVTDGPWDMSRFMYQQCKQSKVKLPHWSRKWINIRKSFCNAYDQTRTSLAMMLESFSIDFEGRPHSGICDSRNIAKILIQMIKDGCYLLINERMYNRKIDSTNRLVSGRNGKKFNGKKFISVSKKELLENGGDESNEEDNDDDDETEEDCAEDENDIENIPSIKKDSDSNIQKTLLNKINVQNDLNETDSSDDCSDLMLYLSLRK